MKKLHRRKKAWVFLLLLLVGATLSFLPSGASSVWKTIFSLFGLTDFSSCADGYPAAVHVLDVGKADSILVECGEHFLLVDGGTPDCGREVCTYLKRRGVKKLDYVVNTHPDKDHIGGLKYVLNRYPVESYLAPEIPQALIPESRAYWDVQDILEKKELKTAVPHAGDTFFLGDLSVQVLGPVQAADNTNDNSIVLRLSYGSVHFLLMGDAGEQEEKDLLCSGRELSANILKVGHHGSDTSTTDEFLRAVNPKYAAISVAWDSNHLPKRETLTRLDNAGVTTYRTDVSGTLIFLTDGKTISVKTEI